MPHTLMLVVVGRIETGDLPVRLYPFEATTRSFALKLNSRDRARLEPIALVVDADTFAECPVGTEVELTLRPVRS